MVDTVGMAVVKAKYIITAEWKKNKKSQREESTSSGALTPKRYTKAAGMPSAPDAVCCPPVANNLPE